MVPEIETPLSNPTASSAARSEPTTRSSTAAKVAPKKKAPKANAECPIFLQKTYHMVDTCDPDVASWSEDGETFVVKNVDVFEKQFIPQFFKHSKFSSFVRQLNFYGFRKIKYNDTIRIDPKLEAATANFWRFRHENFQRGKPELLVEIKRHNSQSAAAEKQSGSGTSAVAKKSEDSSSMKSVVNDLKERIATMSKNIDELTSLVHTMKVKEEDVGGEEEAHVGFKRKKLEFAADTTDMAVEEITSSNLLDISFTPTNIFPSDPSSRQTSITPSDEEFVDDLFNAFGEDGLLDLTGDTSTNDSQVPLRPSTPPLSDDESDRAANNRPDPQMMEKLADALAFLPKEMQEMLVNRLILTIMSTDSMKSHLDACASAAAPKASLVENDDAKVETSAEPQSQTQPQQTIPPESNPEIALPLAAATLGALLSQYAASMKDNNSSKSMLTKSLPVIPAH